MKKNIKPTIYRALDGNEAAAYVAYRLNELCVIYPITPSTQMGEHADQWAAEGINNIFNSVPEVAQMQSEGGVAGAIHGALQTGALVTTFTSSQGLLLMIPNMFRISAELTPTVFHIASRAVASHGMTIYCEHTDIYATRTTGFAMLCSSNVQETHDMALLTQAASLESRIPFLHFFDGFHTSHEMAKIELLADSDLAAMINSDWIMAHRERRITSDHPTARSLVQDNDTYFQSREAVNPYYLRVPEILTAAFAKFKKLTGRDYSLIEYFGDANAERVIVVMGSSAETVYETVAYLNRHGEKVGVLKVRLFRPFPKKDFLAALPASVKAIAVLDRTKEPGAAGEPLYEEIATTMLENHLNSNENLSTLNPLPKIIVGRYGIGSKEFRPAMVKAIFDELAKSKPRSHFTIGIHDDVTHTSLEYDHQFEIESDSTVRAIFYGLGADGTVSANKNTIKIISEKTDNFAQGYFVYDAKKSGSKTTSYLRFGPDKIRSSYLVNSANFIGCHQFSFINRIDVLERAAPNATFLLNSPFAVEEVWDKLPLILQQTIIDKKIKFYVINASKVAKTSGMGHHINVIMQVAFFALSKILPREVAIAKIKEELAKTYASKGQAVIERNFAAVDNTLAYLNEVSVPVQAITGFAMPEVVSLEAPLFVREVLAPMIAGKGDYLPVSAMPCDGTFPTHTTQWEKRNISAETPVWQHENCVQCGQCGIVCPHSVIRAKRYPAAYLKNAPVNFKASNSRGPNATDECYTLQVYLEDCTGCGACIEACPVNQNKSDKQALIMQSQPVSLDAERKAIAFYESLPNDLSQVDVTTVRGIRYVEPMFEFCSACAGCGEAPYLKLLTQLFGDRLIIADACGCSLVFGGYLPTTPWTKNQDGRGPAFGSSLFEDNAEFGFGYLLGIEKHERQAQELLNELATVINDSELVQALISTKQSTAAEIVEQRTRVARLKTKLQNHSDHRVKQLYSLADQLVKHSVWTIGGDGWAYDIGYGGLDHVLASGRRAKVLVLDTEVYSNTGGQASKATARGAVAKFAAQGKPTAKKDLGMMMINYGNIYVASVALGANPSQAIKALQEAENYDGPAIVLAYAHCIAHGTEMSKGMKQQQLAVRSGYWPLYRFNPDLTEQGLSPFQLDSKAPSIPFSEYASNENRFQTLVRSNPDEADRLMKLGQDDINSRWQRYLHFSKLGM